MNFGYAILIVISGMAYFVRGIPTPDEMIADFNAAQKFYASKAYDQALETYQQVNKIESPFLDEDKVTVEFGDIVIPVKEAALYKSGFTYVKLVEDQFVIIDSDEATDEEKEKAEKMVLEYVQKAVEFFDLAQEHSNFEEFKAMAQNQIISAWYAVEDYDKVIQEGEKLIERYENSSYVLDAMYNIGWGYYDKKSYDESIEAFIRLTTRFPTAGYKSERALFQIGECYYDQGKYGDAVPYYELLVNKMRIDRLTPIEIQKIQRDKFSGLTDETALDLAAKAQLKIGACYANEGNYDDAKAAYRRVANLFKFDKGLISEAYQRMADMYYDRGDFEASVLAYRDAIDEIQDEIFRAKMQVFICKRYFTEGEKSNGEYYNDAIREYQYYIGTYSEVASRAGFKLDQAFFWFGRSFYEYGSFLLKKGEEETAYENFESSLSTYQRIIKEFPETDLLPRVYFYEALAYYRYGGENLTKSVNSFNLLLTEFPDTPYKEYCYFFIARANQTMGNYEEAISNYNKILEEFPETTELSSVFMELAAAYNKLNNDPEALKFYLKVSRDIPELFTTARLLAAQYLLSQRDYNEVVNVITYAVEDPSAIENNHRLSQFYLLSGNANKNLENLEDAVADYTRAYDLEQPETQEMASVYRAGVFIEMDQLARAERDLKELVNSDNEEVRKNARMRLAIISVRQDKSEQAIQTAIITLVI